jgi:hypothetical protein
MLEDGIAELAEKLKEGIETFVGHAVGDGPPAGDV